MRKYDKRIKDINSGFIKYGFLVGLLLIVISQFKIDCTTNISFLSFTVEALSRHLSPLIIITIIFGFITLHLEKNRMIDDVKNIYDDEIVAEKKREKEFNAKYLKMAGVKNNLHLVNQKTIFPELVSALKNIFTFFFRLLQPIVRRIYIEGWWYSAGLFIIIALGSLIQLSIIGDYYFWTDEVFSLNAGKMIIDKGVPLFDSGLFYGRSRIYHYLLAGSMYFFGIDEFGSRIINVLFNTLTALLIYYLLKGTTKKIGLLGAFLFMFSNLTIVMTIETRFYSLFTFAFLGLTYSYYKTFIENFNDGLNNILIKFKDNRKWLFLFLFFAYLSYNTHDFFFIFIFGLVLYYFISLVIEKSWKINLVFFLCCAGMIFAGAYYLTGTFNIYYAYIEAVTLDWAADLPKNSSYYTGIIKENVPLYYFLLTTAIAILLTRLSQHQRYYFSLLVAALFIISQQRALQERYLFFLIPFLVLIAVYSLYYLYVYFKNQRITKFIFIIMFIAFAIMHLQLFAQEVKHENNYSSLAMHKKFQFHEAMHIIDQFSGKETLLLADFHAAFTLIAYGYDVSYIVISENQEHLIKKGTVLNGVFSDHYFNIPYLIQETKEYTDLIDHEDLLIVVREDLKPVDGLNVVFDHRPRVYKNF
jgi:hypothetical protein